MVDMLWQSVTFIDGGPLCLFMCICMLSAVSVVLSSELVCGYVSY